MKESSTIATLSPVQHRTLAFVRDYLAEHRHAPALHEIATAIRVKSPSTAHFHLERLVQKGFIERKPGGAIRLIEIAPPALSNTAVPLIGIIAAGVPLEAVENRSFIDIPAHLVSGKGEVFCLEVSGESMIDAHICDQDIVIIKKQDHAEDGQIVVALLPDGSATLKTYRRLKNGSVMLIPANPTMKPITVDAVQIQGKVIGLLRDFR
jgi:repressor LexA